MLAAAVYRRQHGQLRVLDVMSGSGMRGARYIQQVRVYACRPGQQSALRPEFAIALLWYCTLAWVCTMLEQQGSCQ